MIGIEVVEDNVQNSWLLFLREFEKVVQKITEQSRDHVVEQDSLHQLRMLVFVQVQNVIGRFGVRFSHRFGKVFCLHLNVEEDLREKES